MGATTNYGWPLPDGVSAGDVPYWMGQLGNAVDAELSEAWVSYVPVLSGGTWAINNGTAAGWYRELGKTVFFTVQLTMGSTTLYGSGAQLEVSLPVNAKSGGTLMSCPASAVDTSAATRYLLQALIIPTTSQTKCFLYTTAGAAGAMGAVITTQPFAWATGDVITITGMYERT